MSRRDSFGASALAVAAVFTAASQALEIPSGCKNAAGQDYAAAQASGLTEDASIAQERIDR
jgi:hypothetical protein